ncbi:ATP-binding mismatch repair protein [Rhizophlyctis rosea]|uniref:ATP-binding mismatch repair protein n=1 Tax=Rhizophlyctis rosea TaxID=64517 RepID=A0AAD5SHL7_9FUNG|nr:ATP-binding mismatch repair protein [Rhizophlyctis rosea]
MSLKTLPKSTQSRIGSEQVITRPENVVKELVENALDAGAQSIDVRVVDGGLKEISVKDDGTGVLPEDAPSLAKAHTTSKLSSFEALPDVRTYGFRGEALHSIAQSAGKLIITTRTSDEAVGRSYHFNQNGLVTDEGSCAHPLGTTVVVKGLFQKAAVRRQDTISKKFGTSLASHLQSFRVITPLHDEDATYSENGLPDQTVQIDAVLPKANADVDVVTKTTPDRIFVCVNGRPLTVKNKFDKALKKVIKMIKDAFLGEAAGRKDPFVWLHILLPPRLVDVNLEPNKTAVAFNENLIMPCVEKLIEQAFPPKHLPGTIALIDTDGVDAGGISIPTEQSDNDEQRVSSDHRSPTERQPLQIFADSDDDEPSVIVPPNTTRNLVSRSLRSAAPKTMTTSPQLLTPERRSSVQANPDPLQRSNGPKSRGADGLADVDPSVAYLFESPSHESTASRKRPSPSTVSPSPAKRTSVSRSYPSPTPSTTQPTLRGFMSGNFTPAKPSPKRPVVSHPTQSPKRVKVNHPVFTADESVDVALDYGSVRKSYWSMLRNREHGTESGGIARRRKKALQVVGTAAMNANAAWAVRVRDHVLLLNVTRMLEVVHFKSLMSSYSVRADPLPIPLCMNTETLGPDVVIWMRNYLRRTVGNDATGARKVRVDDPRVLKNGFEVVLREERNEIILDIIGVTTILEPYNETDLASLIRTLQTHDAPSNHRPLTPTTDPISSSRPRKVVDFFMKESKGLARQQCLVPSEDGEGEAYKRMASTVGDATRRFFEVQGGVEADTWICPHGKIVGKRLIGEVVQVGAEG